MTHAYVNLKALSFHCGRETNELCLIEPTNQRPWECSGKRVQNNETQAAASLVIAHYLGNAFFKYGRKHLEAISLLS